MDQSLSRILKRGVSEIIIEQELIDLLSSGQQLRLKQGFDPSAPDIHLGHVVGLRKLRQFQDLGHKVILIVGDWTAQIGDPSGQSVTRPMLTPEQVKHNAETYMAQFFKVVDREKTQVEWQSQWFGKFGLREVINLTSKFTVAQFLAREDFSKRYKEGRPIAITELLYPLMQAYDSVAIQADVEFGGIDQKFNCLVGRELQTMLGQRPQQILLVPLLVGTDGTNKMSKSLGNYIGVTDPPSMMYGKVMSIPDSLILPYLELLTDMPDEELEGIRQEMECQSANPMEFKKWLARDLVSQFHGPAMADEAAEEFSRIFQKGAIPEAMPEFVLDREMVQEIKSPTVEDARMGGGYLLSVPALLTKAGLASSRSEARRLILQGAVDISDHTIGDTDWLVKPNSVIKVGKRRFIKLVFR